MEDLSRYNEHIFWNASSRTDLYLKGGVPHEDSDFGTSFDGGICIVPFSAYSFATRDSHDPIWEDKKQVLDEWVQNGGIEGINRFLTNRDLTTALKKGTQIELLAEFPGNVIWRERGSFYLPADSITAIKIIG